MKSFEYYLNKVGEVGDVEAATKSVVWVNGLPAVTPNELILFETGQKGQTLFLHPNQAEVMLFSEEPVKAGTRAVRTGEQLQIPVGKELLGQVINPLGQRIWVKASFRQPRQFRHISFESPGIEQRASVRKPLETGVSLVDMLVPLGCGQRELVIGDRKTGKTSFLLQTVLNQAKKGMICIWTVIGKKESEIKQIAEYFSQRQVIDKMIMVAASAQDPIGLIYLAPYTAITLAEYFRDLGKSCLLILDDLTIHARFYRQLALLSRRFPGRDSYPVDIFFTHASILEKGGNFRCQKGEVSITILPVAETSQGDLSGYIQTNLMSMTDGHIYFDRTMFAEGRRPAINPFLSVTRVGRQAQTLLCREFNRKLMAFLTYYKKLESYVHFGAELTEEVKTVLARGEKLIKFFDQSASNLVPTNITVFLLGCLWLDFRLEKEPIIKKYQENKQFQKQVDALVTQSTGFEDFLKSLEFLREKL